MMNKEKTICEYRELLDFCDCYKYSSEGLEMWFDTSVKEKKFLDDALSKHPFYNGNGQVVVPFEEHRDIDPAVASLFAPWLESVAKKRRYLVKNCDMSYKECDEAIARTKSVLDKFKEFSGHMVVKGHDQSYYEDEMTHLIRIKARITFFLDGKNSIEEDGEFYLPTEESSAIQNMANALRDKRVLREIVDEESIPTFEAWGINAVKGQKTTRLIMKLCSKYKVVDDEEFQGKYAQFSDALSPKTFRRYAVLSVNSVDFLTACFGKNWSSCCTIDKKNNRARKISASRSSVTSYVDEAGEYAFAGDHAGAMLGYMFDSTTMVYYTISNKADLDRPEMADKIVRQLFHYDHGKLIQSRMYPQSLDDVSEGNDGYNTALEFVTGVLAECFAVNNNWYVRRSRSACANVTVTNPSNVGYIDYFDERNRKVTLSQNEELLSGSDGYVHIGGPAICPNCGCSHTESHSLNCGDC